MIIILSYFGLLTACNSGGAKKTESDSPKEAKVTIDSVREQNDIAKAPTDSAGIIAATAKKFLAARLKDDLAKGLIDSMSRKFIIDHIDLNHDGINEIFVGLTGTYFCGSGGCTCYLLTADGKLITRFTVLEYPIAISSTLTNGWNDLLIESRGKYHLMVYKNNQYPSNPSVQPVAPLPANARKVLDVTRSEIRWHSL